MPLLRRSAKAPHDPFAAALGGLVRKRPKQTASTRLMRASKPVARPRSPGHQANNQAGAAAGEAVAGAIIETPFASEDQVQEAIRRRLTGIDPEAIIHDPYCEQGSHLTHLPEAARATTA